MAPGRVRNDRFQFYDSVCGFVLLGDRNYLDATVTYNEDDCRATYHLKRWLEQWQQKHYGDRLPAPFAEDYADAIA